MLAYRAWCLPSTDNGVPTSTFDHGRVSDPLRFDVAVIGAGVLGVTVAFWISQLYDCSIALIDKDDDVACHASSRNTGVIHRPFYIHPQKKKSFAQSSERSYNLWQKLAMLYKLPWVVTGTLEVATRDSDLATLEQYHRWGLENGMEEDELELLDGTQVAALEPLVSCRGALYSRKDTAVDFRSLTKKVFELSRRNGVTFLPGNLVLSLAEREGRIRIVTTDGGRSGTIDCSLLVNSAGGDAVDVAHLLGLAREYTDLHFRGEYWKVDDHFGSGISRNIYSVATYSDFPFLDPHFIVRADGRREIGPNATLTLSPDSYRGLANNPAEFVKTLLERPNMPKLRLLTNSKFLRLVQGEWRSSVSKKAMCKRVMRFVPKLRPDLLTTRGTPGVRSPVIDRNGFASEAIILMRTRSVHVLNYNSPGATGAPAFSASLVSDMVKQGYFEGLSMKTSGLASAQIWDFERAASSGSGSSC